MADWLGWLRLLLPLGVLYMIVRTPFYLGRVSRLAGVALGLVSAWMLMLTIFSGLGDDFPFIMGESDLHPTPAQRQQFTATLERIATADGAETGQDGWAPDTLISLTIESGMFTVFVDMNGKLASETWGDENSAKLRQLSQDALRALNQQGAGLVAIDRQNNPVCSPADCR